MSDYDEDEGRLTIDEGRLDTSGDASQQKADESVEKSQVSEQKKEAGELEEGQIVDKSDGTSEVVVEQGRVPFNPPPITDERLGAADVKSNAMTDSKPFGFNQRPPTGQASSTSTPVKEATPGRKSAASTPKLGKQDSEEYVSDKDNVGVKNFLPTSSTAKPPRPKKKKMVDKSTCVSTKACQIDESLLGLKPGMTACINITIVCKAGSNTLYITAKWKGKEYHGILTDGEPPMAHHFAQKRNAANAAAKEAEQANGDSAEHSQGASGKNRGKRGGSRVEKRPRNNEGDEAPNAEENGVGPSTGGASMAKPSKQSKLCELPADKPLWRCPHAQCGHRFETGADVNTHMIMDHVDTKLVMKESIATQTTSLETASVECNTEPLADSVCVKCGGSTSQRLIEDRSIDELMKIGRQAQASVSTKGGSEDGDAKPPSQSESAMDTSSSAVLPSGSAVITTPQPTAISTAPAKQSPTQAGASIAANSQIGAVVLPTAGQQQYLQQIAQNPFHPTYNHPSLCPPSMQGVVPNLLQASPGARVHAAAAAGHPTGSHSPFAGANGMSPVPSGSAGPSKPVDQQQTPMRHKIHELKSPQVTASRASPLPSASSAGGLTVGRPITSGNQPVASSAPPIGTPGTPGMPFMRAPTPNSAASSAAAMFGMANFGVTPQQAMMMQQLQQQMRPQLAYQLPNIAGMGIPPEQLQQLTMAALFNHQQNPMLQPPK